MYFFKESVLEQLCLNKFNCVSSSDFILSTEQQNAWHSLQETWQDLGQDKYYKSIDGNRRLRRYSTFSLDTCSGQLQLLPHNTYFQSKKQNSVAGGMERNFEPVAPQTFENNFFVELVKHDFSQFPIREEFQNKTWVVQVHQIRIVVSPGLTTAVTPEGIHSDGYPFAAVHLVNRNNVLGGESIIYNLEEQPLQKVLFSSPLDSLYFEDRNFKHYVTPITGKGENGMPGIRDILAISFSLPSSPYWIDV